MPAVRLLCAVCFLVINGEFLTKAATIPTQNLEARQTIVNKDLQYYYESYPDLYTLRYKTPNGIIHFEVGSVHTPSNGMPPYNVKQGYYIYPTPEGKKVRVGYFADNKGTRVSFYDIQKHDFEEVEFEVLLALARKTDEIWEKGDA